MLTIVCRSIKPSFSSCCCRVITSRKTSTDTGAASETKTRRSDDGEFRVLRILPEKRSAFVVRDPPRFRVDVVKEARFKKQSTKDANWSNVWPAARVFHPAVVPLPVHMGHIERPDLYAPPDKWNNLELMKIPNFLHLTPPAIKMHCKALKKFCTKWPKDLKTDQDCWNHFPLEYITSDYVHASPTIRNPEARAVTLRFKLEALPLDAHAKDKLKRLLNAKVERYNVETDIVTLTSDKCPMRRQNQDYINYLLTACFFESWKTESWESEKELNDWECFFWDKSDSKRKVVEYLQLIDGTEVVDEYRESVTAIYDEGEHEETVDMYKKSVLKLLDVKAT